MPFMLLNEYFMEWGENMANKVGRKDKYETNVLPFLEQIGEWMKYKNTDKFIAESLGLALSTWMKYKAEKKELKELIDKIPEERVNLVADLKKALVQRAKGFEYEEEKIYIEANEDGTTRKKKEIYKRKALPETAAIEKALNIYDEDYIPNRANYKLKEKELDWRIQQGEKEKQ